MAEFDGVEIPEELLECVTGGSLTPAEREQFIRGVKKVKAEGYSQNVPIKLILDLNSIGDKEERIALIKEVYASE